MMRLRGREEIKGKNGLNKRCHVARLEMTFTKATPCKSLFKSRFNTKFFKLRTSYLEKQTMQPSFLKDYKEGTKIKYTQKIIRLSSQKLPSYSMSR